MTVRIGFQTHVHSDAPARELLPGLVDLFQAADELGLDSGWVAQHHLGNGAGRLPSPLVLLAAAAAATRRIRLGTTVVVLPLEDPLRVAEDAAVLDALAQGRLELGIGAGGPSSPEFAAFGYDAEARHELYATKQARLRSALRGDDLGGGLRLTPDGASILGRIWESPSTPERAAAVAAAGNGLLLGVGSAPAQRRLADAYLAAIGDNAPRIGAFRGAFPGTGREERTAALWPDVRHVADHPLARAHLGLDGDADARTLLEALVVHYGTLDDIVASVRRDPSLEVATDYVFAVQAASTPIADAIRTVEAIAAEIGPALGWAPPRDGAGTGGSDPAPAAPHDRRGVSP